MEDKVNAARAALVHDVAAEVVAQLEAKWGERLSKLAAIPRIRTAADATRRDVALMLHKIDGDTVEATGGFECCTLRGTKRAQFMRLCEIKKANPDYAIRRCARMVLDEIRGEDGYTDVDALGEYAAMHRSWWLVLAKDEATEADASAPEGGAE
ncbi:MAG: hypothetical protein ACI4QF_03240 [Kiritimatiellia bacterium]